MSNSSPAMTRSQIKTLHLKPGEKQQVLKILASEQFTKLKTLAEQIVMILGDGKKTNKSMKYLINLEDCRVMFGMNNVGTLNHHYRHGLKIKSNLIKPIGRPTILTEQEDNALLQEILLRENLKRPMTAVDTGMGF